MTAAASALAQHSSKSNEHYTPIDVIEAAREVMGSIDLDPATTDLVNWRVRATNYYTKETNGFDKDWHGRVWLNPPGGKIGNKSNAALWWNKLVTEYLAERTKEAIFLGFTLEILATSQDALCWLGNFPICIPRNRLPFDHEAVVGSETVLVSGDSPAHSNVIAYLPGDDIHHNVDKFVQVFSKFGKVLVPGAWS